MSERRLNIGIRTRAERTKSLREVLRQVVRGNKSTRHGGLYFESIAELRQILTEKRLELLRTITQQKPASVRELAELLRRDYKNVSTDVALFERLGLVRLQAGSSKGGPRTLTVPYDEIQVTIALRAPGVARTRTRAASSA